jgi:hypothetical protein
MEAALGKYDVSAVDSMSLNDEADCFAAPARRAGAAAHAANPLCSTSMRLRNGFRNLGPATRKRVIVPMHSSPGSEMATDSPTECRDLPNREFTAPAPDG